MSNNKLSVIHLTIESLILRWNILPIGRGSSFARDRRLLPSVTRIFIAFDLSTSTGSANRVSPGTAFGLFHRS